LRFYRVSRHFFLVALLITAALQGKAQNDSLDSIPQPIVKEQPKGGFLDSKVHYKAKDSIRFDLIEQKVYLFGEGDVTYDNINLKAEYIELNLVDKTVFAKYGLDSLGREIGKPVFSEGEQSFTSSEMKYNFETKKGLIKEVRTKEGESYVQGETVKRDSNEVVYIRKGKYTTCDLEHPHYSINAGKLKVIPDDKIVTGPAYLEVADIPTPLGIPFGFFPNKKGQASGIIVPQYGESQGLGFFLRDGGYYFGINDTFDLALRGDVYSYGSWAVDAETNYKIRYRYSGNVQLSYARMIFDDPELPGFKPQNDFKVMWSHTQDPKSNPNNRFSASVNAGTSTYNQYNSYTTAQYLNNQLASNISYSRLFERSQLTVNARHNQNTQTKQVTIIAPELTYNVNRFFPAKSLRNPKKIVKNNWYNQFYNNLGIAWVTNASNNITTYDSLLFNRDFDDIARYGLRTSIPITSSIQFKYFTFTPSLSWAGNAYFRKVEYDFESTPDTYIVPAGTYNEKPIPAYHFITAEDTVSQYVSEYIDTTITKGYFFTREMLASASFTTKLTGQANFNKGIGSMTAIRHVITPSIGFSYRPDYGSNQYGYYRNVQVNASGTNEVYSIFQGGIYGTPQSGKSGLVNWSVNNNVEAKLRNITDTAGTVVRKVTFIESFLISGNYNLSADNLKWSAINMSGRTKLFKKVDITVNGTFDPYAADTVFNVIKRIERFQYDVDKKLARMTNANITVGTSLQSKRKNEKPRASNKGSEQELEFINNNPQAFVDFNVPWMIAMNYTFFYQKPFTESTITQSINLNGDFSLTPKWKVGFNTNYNLEEGRFAYSSLNIYRDLHCWEMVFHWVPFGPGQYYVLDIKVKAPVLSDLKLTRRRDPVDFM
jgi:hypothetical protein